MSDLDLTFDDFEVKEETSAENTTIETKPEESKEEIKAESPTETKAEDGTQEGEPTEAKKEGEDSGAESPTAEYKPNFSYKIKDTEHEFPEYLREVVKDEKTEQEIRDLLTKADALEGIKESRAAIETQHNDYIQNVENNIYPVLDKISEFDKANSLKDFSKAWELSDVNPNDVIDHLLMDENLSQTVYQKVLDQMKLEEQGPQAIQQVRTNYQEQNKSRSLELQNQQMEAKLKQMEEQNYNTALNFALNQHQDVASKYDSVAGEGSFKKFVEDYSFMKKSRGESVLPAEGVSQAANMLGVNLGNATPTQGNNENTQEHVKVAPQEPKQPDVLPNIGTGSNVSMVQKQASTWDEFEKSMGSF